MKEVKGRIRWEMRRKEVSARENYLEVELSEILAISLFIQRKVET